MIADSRDKLAITATVCFCILAVLPISALILSVLINDPQLPTNTTTTSLSRLFLSSLIFSSCVTLSAIALGSLLALVIVKTNLAYKSMWLGLFSLPLFIPTNIQAIIWSELLGQQTGINQWLTSFYDLQNPLIEFNPWFAAAWVQMISYFPIILLTLSVGFIRWDYRWSEACQFYSHSKQLRLVLMWRYFRNYFGISGLLVFIFSMSDFAVADLFQVHVYATEIFLQLSAYMNISGAIITSIPTLMIGLLLLYWIYQWLEHVPLTENDGRNKQPKMVKLNNKLQLTIHVIFILLALLIIVLPVGLLISQIESLYTLGRVFSNAWHDIVTSIIISLCATLLTLCTAFITAYAIHRKLKTAGIWLRLGLLFVLILPSSFIGIAYITLWNNPLLPNIFYQQGLIIPLALCLLFLPIAVEIFLLQLKKLPQSMEQAAFVCNIGLLTSLKITLLPKLKPTINIIGIFCFIFCFNELTTTLLIAPPGLSILPVRLFSLVHYGPKDLIAALSLLQLFVLAIPILYLLKYRHNVIYKNKTS